MSERAVLSSVNERPPAPAGPMRASGQRGLRVAALAAMSATFALVAIGALVRATGSGLGCPGWPKCFGRWFPPLEHHAVIEYSHRLVTVIDTVLVLLLAGVALLRYRGGWARRVLLPSLVAVGLIFLQAALGALVVEGELHALLVTAHFMNAIVLAGVLVYATVSAFSIPTVLLPVDALAWLGRGATALVFALLGVGAYVRGHSAGLAFRDWPLMDGKLLPSLSQVRPALQFTHRSLAALAFLFVAWLAVRAWRDRGSRPGAAALALIGVGLFGAQVLIGAANVWSGLAAPAVTAHVAVAALTSGALVGATAASRVGSREA